MENKNITTLKIIIALSVLMLYPFEIIERDGLLEKIDEINHTPIIKTDDNKTKLFGISINPFLILCANQKINAKTVKVKLK